MTPQPPPRNQQHQQPPTTAQSRLQILNRPIRSAGLALLTDRKGPPQQRRPALVFLFADNTAAAITTATPGQQAGRGLVLRRLDQMPDFVATFADLARRRITEIECRGRGLHLTIEDRPGLVVVASDDGTQLEIETLPARRETETTNQAPAAADTETAAQLAHLAKLVRETRERQRLYFQTRSPAVLAEAKALEKQLDQALEATARPVFVHHQQRHLFGE